MGACPEIQERLFLGKKKAPAGTRLGDTWLKIKKIIPLDPTDIILLKLRIRAPSNPKACVYETTLSYFNYSTYYLIYFVLFN